MSKEILEDIIREFDLEKFERFFRKKSTLFAQKREDLSYYNDEDFTDGVKLGEIRFEDDYTLLVICALKVAKELTERSSKKKQYEKAKRILKDSYADGGHIHLLRQRRKL